MPISFRSDIKPLFRPRDISSMKTFGQFDLSKYEDVVANSEDILARLKKGDMPCDGAWTAERISLFQQWIADGKLP
jgi:hypothetical protein